MSFDFENEEESTEESLWAEFSKHDGALRADICVQLSQFAYQRDDYAEALSLCETALGLYESFSDVACTEFMVQGHFGIIYSLASLDRHREAAEAAERAVAVMRLVGPSEGAEILRYAGLAWYELEEYERSIQNYELALLEPDLEVTDHKIAIDFFNIAMGYLGLECWRKAERKIEVARKYFQLDSDEENARICDEKLAECDENLGNVT